MCGWERYGLTKNCLAGEAWLAFLVLYRVILLTCPLLICPGLIEKLEKKVRVWDFIKGLYYSHGKNCFEFAMVCNCGDEPNSKFVFCKVNITLK